MTKHIIYRQEKNCSRGVSRKAILLCCKKTTKEDWISDLTEMKEANDFAGMILC